MSDLEVHEAAAIFPLDEEGIDVLAADIREHGLRVPLETLDGKLIDGRRRLAACRKAGVEPTVRAVRVDDPVAYVVSLNLHRRHLTPSQRAMCAARATALREKLAAKAKERQRGGRGGKLLQENLPEAKGQSRDQAGKLFDVSGRSVDYATRVVNNAVPEVVRAVEEGRMAVDTAAILSTEPPEVQRQEAASPKRRRDYRSVSGTTQKEEEDKPAKSNGEVKVQGVGVVRAHEAINCLMRIPKNDPLRKRGFQIVTDWIRRTQKGER